VGYLRRLLRKKFDCDVESCLDVVKAFGSDDDIVVVSCAFVAG
jgi:hypothetical protein